MSKMMMVLVGFGASCSVFLNVMLIQYHTENKKLQTRIQELDTEDRELGRKQAIYQYNSGYRAGRFEAMAELIECENLQTPEVMRDYKAMEEVLASFGELDTAPYPCEE